MHNVCAMNILNNSSLSLLPPLPLVLQNFSTSSSSYFTNAASSQGIMIFTDSCLNQFMPTVAFSQPILPTVPTFAVRETDVSRHIGGTSGVPLKPLRDDSALRALSSLRVLRGVPEGPPLCRETQSLGQQIKNW